MRDVLEFAGYEVIEATTARTASGWRRRSDPHLILMDLQLPGIDGAEALRQIRVGPDGQDVPVVAVTAFAMDEDRDPGVRAGFDGYLEKPISVRALPEQVREFLDRGGRP